MAKRIACGNCHQRRARKGFTRCGICQGENRAKDKRSPDYKSKR